MRVPLMMIVSIVIVTLMTDGYIWCYLRKRARQSRWSKLYAWSCVLCWLLLIVTMLMPRRDAGSSILPVMWMLYTYITIYASKIIFMIVSAFGFISRLWRAHYIRPMGIIAFLLASVVFIIFWWGAFWGRQNLEVTHYTFSSQKVPPQFDGFRIVQISDLHVGTWGTDIGFIQKLVERVNDQHPDVIFFTGDIVNRNTDELLPFVDELGALKAKYGVYSVLGNHDYGNYQEWDSEEEHLKNNERLASLEKRMGWHLLNNSHLYLTEGNDSIVLIGVENWGEPPFGQYGDLDKAYPREKQHDTHLKILMSHNPEHWKQVVSRKTNIDLTLSGHTHAMQMMVKAGNYRWSPAQYKYKQWAGAYAADTATLNPRICYVNIGAGEVGMPFRIGARPEITVITLKNR